MARKLEKTEWQPFLDRVSKGLIGKLAEIEVASAKLGAQIEAEWVPLIGLAYDPKSDIVEIAVQGLDHMIRRPQELYVEEEAGRLISLEVIDSEGTRQIMKLKDPLMLAGPGG
jgi:hypothetical protein